MAKKERVRSMTEITIAISRIPAAFLSPLDLLRHELSKRDITTKAPMQATSINMVTIGENVGKAE